MNRLYSRIKDSLDTRDFLYDASNRIAIPDVFDMRPKCSPVKDQGQEGSCTGHAAVAACEYVENVEGEVFISLSDQFAYYNERLLEGDTDQDAGGEIRDVIKSVVEFGICEENLWPYIEAKFAVKPSLEAYSNALTHKALMYHRVAQTENDMLHRLASGFPIVVGINVYDSFESDEVAKTGIVPMPCIGENNLGGHAVLVVGYDRNARTFLMRNSWSANWGMEGYFTIPFDYLLNPDLAEDFWTITKVS